MRLSGEWGYGDPWRKSSGSVILGIMEGRQEDIQEGRANKTLARGYPENSGRNVLTFWLWRDYYEIVS